MPENVGNADAEYVRKDVFDAHMQRMEEKITALLEKNFIATKAEIRALGDRIDATNERMDQKFASVNERMDQKFTSVNERMEQGFAMVNARIDAVNARIDATNTRIDDLHSFMGWGFATATICITLFSMTLPILTQYLSKRLEKRASASSRKKTSPGRSPRLAGAVSVR